MSENAARKIRRQLFWLLLAFLSSVPYAYACLQGEEGSVPFKERVEVEGRPAAEFMKAFVTHKDRAYWERVRAANVKLGKGDDEPSLLVSNGLAVALIHLGHVGEAVPILEKAERQNPGRYMTAANLGTAYELAGDNRKALVWIREGVRRNPDSHYATEWLHIKILEAKLALESNPAWLSKNSVLGVDLRARADDANRPSEPVIDHRGRTKSPAEVESALVYQLHERMEFVKPPDPVVADLLLALSNLLGRTRSEEHARLVRDLAYNYGAPQQAPVTSAAAAPPAPQSPNRPYLLYASLAGAALLLSGGLYALSKKRRLR